MKTAGPHLIPIKSCSKNIHPSSFLKWIIGIHQNQNFKTSIGIGACLVVMTRSCTLAIAWFTTGEASSNCSIAVSLLEIGSQQFTPGVIITDRVNYTNLNPVLFWDNDTQT